MSKKPNNPRSGADTKRRHEHELEGGAGGAIVGAALGSLAGPPGAGVGAVIGAIVGAIAGAAVGDEEASNDAQERKLDDEIGVTSGEIGAPNLDHPPPTIGAYSGGSSGASSSGGESAEGPMQTPD